LISHGTPEFRKDHLTKPEFGWELTKIINVFRPAVKALSDSAKEDKDTPLYHYVYICKKVGIKTIIINF